MSKSNAFSRNMRKASCSVRTGGSAETARATARKPTASFSYAPWMRGNSAGGLSDARPTREARVDVARGPLREGHDGQLRVHSQRRGKDAAVGDEEQLRVVRL